MDDDELTVWCGNLPSEIDEELLYELFLQAAPLKKVCIPMQQKTNRPSNFAFVTFKHHESVSYAINLLHNTKLYDNHIIVRQRTKAVVNLSTFDGNSSIGDASNTNDNRPIPIDTPHYYPQDSNSSHKKRNKFKRHERRSWHDYHENDNYHNRNDDGYNRNDNHRHKHRYSDQNRRKRFVY